MKPITLTMTAFGPYKEKEVIDFNQLKDQHLFVISGATGAGKTTIFDGICFALYGSASGMDREDPSILRSHFAADDVHTTVEFVFAINGRTYRVLRQLGHIKEGNKTKTGEKYELMELHEQGREFPCVERQIISEINEKLEAIIGLTQDQFKQIVMLPQGEFRKLLTSETENKEAILRRLFKTERYKQMNQILKENKDVVKERYHQEKNLRDYHIQQIHSTLKYREDSVLFQFLLKETYNTQQILDGLQEERVFLGHKKDASERNYKKGLEMYEEQQTNFHQAKGVNDRFIELDEKKKVFERLQEQKGLISRKEEQVNAAERASRIEGYEKQVVERRHELAVKKEHVKQAVKDVEATKERLNQAEIAYQEERGNEETRTGLTKVIDKYNEMLPVVQEIKQNKETLTILESEGKHTAGKLNNMVDRLKEKEKEIEKSKSGIAKIEGQVAKRDKLVEARYELREKYRILNDVYTIQTQFEPLEKEIKRTEAAYKSAEKTYKQAETLWFQNQAAILAGHLSEGDHCPVCGSLHHPNKATDGGEGITKAAFDQAKADYENKQKVYFDALPNYQSLLSRLEEGKVAAVNLKIAFDEVEAERISVLEKGRKVGKELEALDELAKQLMNERERVRRLENDVKEAREQKETFEKQLEKNRADYLQLHTVITERLTKIPVEIQEYDALQIKLKEMETEKLRLEKRWEQVQQELQDADKASDQAQVKLDYEQKLLTEIEGIVQRLEKEFDEQLRLAHFENETDYQAAKMTAAAKQVIQTEIDAFKQQFTMLKSQIAELNEQLSGKERFDIEAMEIELKKAKTQSEEAWNQWNEMKEQYEKATSIHEQIVHAEEKLNVLEEEFAAVDDLYDVLRGQNAKKISFERYLQIDYLDQIIHVANERFKGLTNGQFYLIRSDRQEARGRQSGLSIDVHDAYTGRIRDVKSLSGGEKFIASLCLALGMADVIQGFQGSISMDTMFIDEGFGSLDEESLHKSIDALIQLQQTGRMIGVISHVEELKAIFPAMLQVTKTKDGHSQTKFVLK